jgi:glycosyltransferase involved in cell wall biosynthesis
MHHPYMAERGILRGLGYRDPTYFFTILSKFKSAQVACRKATKIVAVSRFTARGVVKGYGIPPEKITVVPDAVDTSRFNPCVSGLETREQWKLDSEPVIVFVGRVAQNKGLDVLLKAFKNLIQDIPDAKLFIIGEETKTYARARPNETVLEGLRRMVIEFNLTKSVRFLGKAPEESLPKIYATADVIVLPSLLEGFGMTLLEAMATAKPCVATRVGGVPEVVMDGETGLLVPPGDSVALQRAMSTVLDDRLLSRRLGQAGRQRVESKFALDIVTKEMVGVYQRTLEKSQ